MRPRPKKKPRKGNGELPPVVTERQIAPLLGVHEGTLSNWRVQNIGPPFVRVGRDKRGVRYVVEQVLAWRDGRTVYPEGKVSRLK